MSESERKPCAWYVYACVWACEQQRERQFAKKETLGFRL